MATLEGGCLCGAVRYEASGLSGPIVHCHCRTCRKAHGAAFATTARAPRSGFRWTEGAGEVRSYESSPGKRRHFCVRCGSHMMAEWQAEDEVILRLGTLDSDPGSRPVAHIWTEQKASWYELEAALPAIPQGRARKGPETR